MFNKLALAAAAAAVFSTGVTATASASAATGPATRNAPTCTAHQVGKHWECIKPGSICPAAAKNSYGYPENSKRRYRCTQSADHRWHWKRA
jgi:hypothetical protein